MYRQTDAVYKIGQNASLLRTIEYKVRKGRYEGSDSERVFMKTPTTDRAIAIGALVLAVVTHLSGEYYGAPQVTFASKALWIAWAIWITYQCLWARHERKPVTEAVLEDFHSGWTGSGHMNNTYYFALPHFKGSVYLHCFMWTPESCMGTVFLEDEEGKPRGIFQWKENTTRNRYFPEGIGNGADGINGRQNGLVQGMDIESFPVDITAFVRPAMRYKARFEYQSGANGTWIKGIRVQLQ